jgi:hypothetical protein
LGYGRFGGLDLRGQVDDLYEKAWLPLRNHFTPVMKLIEKQRIGSKVHKRYDTPATPCDRLMACAKVSEETKTRLRTIRASLDPMALAADIEARLGGIFAVVERLDEERQDEMERAGELPGIGTVGADSVTAPVAGAPYACTASAPTEILAKPTPKNQKNTKRRVS